MDNPNVRPQINPEDSEVLFYNVLPKNKTVGSVKTNMGDVAPTMVPRPPNKFWLTVLKYKWLVFGGLGIAILAIAAYFVVQIIAKPKPVDTTLLPVTKKNVPAANTQSPADSIAPEWRKQFFGSEVCSESAICGPDADPDHDGLTNLEEYKLHTDPNNKDSDSDGLADGDEIHVFGTDPTKLRTNQNFTFNDADYAKGGFDIITNSKLTGVQLEQIKSKIKQFGLHQPTITTLGDASLQMYDFVNPDAESASLKNIDMQPQAKLDRDTQRLATIRKIGVALLKYQIDFKTFPSTTDFAEMVSKIKAYTTVATNFSDPINQDKYVYTYASQNKDTDFVITYYSETQNQVIKYTSADAKKDSSQDVANVNDDQRVRDLETIKQALMIYSSGKTDSNSNVQYVFPSADQYKTELVPKYLATLPVDPKTKKDYTYTVSDKFDSFTLKAILENPPKGTTGYLCNQEEACRNY